MMLDVILGVAGGIALAGLILGFAWLISKWASR